MSNEILSQDEIDTLIKRTQVLDATVPLSISNVVSPQMIATVKAMLKRYYYTLTNCGHEEQRTAKCNLQHAAFNLWLNRYGFVNKSEYIKFINNEVDKRCLGWKLGIRQT